MQNNARVSCPSKKDTVATARKDSRAITHVLRIWSTRGIIKIALHQLRYCDRCALCKLIASGSATIRGMLSQSLGDVALIVAVPA